MDDKIIPEPEGLQVTWPSFMPSLNPVHKGPKGEAHLIGDPAWSVVLGAGCF